VTLQLAGIDRTAPPAFRPCDWVTTSEAASLLGRPVTATARGDEAGSVEVTCGYERAGEYSVFPGDAGWVDSELLLTGAFPVDAAAQFAVAAAGNATTVDGVGVEAACVVETTSTPPVTTLEVLLDGDRLYRATESYYASCDKLKRFAQAAVSRIPN
jgi:hypothetical protein